MQEVITFQNTAYILILLVVIVHHSGVGEGQDNYHEAYNHNKYFGPQKDESVFLIYYEFSLFDDAKPECKSHTEAKYHCDWIAELVKGQGKQNNQLQDEKNEFEKKPDDIVVQFIPKAVGIDGGPGCYHVGCTADGGCGPKFSEYCDQ